MSLTAHAVRSFLIQRPPPHSIRLTGADGESSDIVVGHRSKAKLAETIVAMNPELIECLDSSGNLLRATRPDPEMPARSQLAPVPPSALITDPETARLTHFANLIHRAYEHATDIAFAKLVEVVERMGDRTDAIEQRLERAEVNYRREQRERIDDAWDRVEEAAERAEQGDVKDQLLTSFVQGAVQGQGGRSNGKAKANGGAS